MKTITVEQKIKSYSLEILFKVWMSLNCCSWNEQWEGGKINKKNVIKSLMSEDVFDESAIEHHTHNGEYCGLSLGKHATIEDSLLAYIENYVKTCL